MPLTLLLLLCQVGFCWKSLDHALGGDVDFRVFYSSGHMLATGLGNHLYEYDTQTEIQSKLVNHADRTLPFLYPAFAAALFLPFSLLPYKIAFFLFSLANLCLLGISGFWVRSQLTLLQKSPSWLPGYLSLTFFPVSIAIMQGQLSVILLSLYTLFFVFHRKHCGFTAGLFLAGTLIKFQIALPVAFLFLLWRQWRVIYGFTFGAITLTAVSLVVGGPHAALQYSDSLFKVVRESLENVQAARLHYGMFPADMPNLRGLLVLISKGNWVGQTLALLCSAGLITCAARHRPSIAIALPVAMMVSYHMQAYDLTLLLLPIAIVIDHLWAERTLIMKAPQVHYAPPEKKARWVLSISLALLVVPAAPVILIKGLCGLFAIPALGILWVATYHNTDLRDSVEIQPLEIIAPQPC